MLSNKEAHQKFRKESWGTYLTYIVRRGYEKEDAETARRWAETVQNGFPELAHEFETWVKTRTVLEHVTGQLIVVNRRIKNMNVTTSTKLNSMETKRGRELTREELQTINLARKREFGSRYQLQPALDNREGDSIFFLLKNELDKTLAVGKIQDIKITFKK